MYSIESLNNDKRHILLKCPHSEDMQPSNGHHSISKTTRYHELTQFYFWISVGLINNNSSSTFQSTLSSHNLGKHREFLKSRLSYHTERHKYLSQEVP